MIMDAVGLNFFLIFHCPGYIRLTMVAIIKSIGMVACVKKYLVNASMAHGFNFFFFIKTRIIVNIYFKADSDYKSL